LLLILAPTARADPEPIIDAHLHAFPPASFGEPPPPNPLTNEPTPHRSDAELMEATIAELARAGVVRAVTSGPLPQVRAWRNADPTRIVPAVYLGEYWEFHPAERLRPLFESGELAVLGELGLQYIGLAPAAEQLRAHFELAAELDIPVGIHTGLGPPGIPNAPCCADFKIDLGKPSVLEEVVKRHPQLRVYIMHAGWPFLQETIALLYVYPNVYADLSVINWLLPRAEFHSYLEALVRAGLSDRLMYGSDQMIWPEAIPTSIEAIESASFLTPAQKRAIFHDNAARFFRFVPGGARAAQHL
jgi:predicted TIM-barrel fold metal-dependent hydrolase